jgi:hypothetical protein
MPKPELATADEAIFKIRFKKIVKSRCLFYLDKGRLYYSVKNKISKVVSAQQSHFKFTSKCNSGFVVLDRMTICNTT